MQIDIPNTELELQVWMLKNKISINEVHKKGDTVYELCINGEVFAAAVSEVYATVFCIGWFATRAAAKKRNENLDIIHGAMEALKLVPAGSH